MPFERDIGVPFFQYLATNCEPLLSKPATYTSLPDINTE
ncbi:MAG: hypothetical protein JST09_04670 [Bacteroidetes bacterium]|nr:hypothetical protein [Chitinophagaceae bacterium]MBS1574577.1 hypothetical protein [Bacteroidota bacterium]